jgi:flagellar motor switch protein FliN
MSKFIAGWLAQAEEILGQDFGGPVVLLPGGAIPASAASVTWTVDIAGDWEGTFAVTAELAAIAASFGSAVPGEADQDGAAAAERWERNFKRICIAAAAALGAESGRSCEVAMISPGGAPVGREGMGYQLRCGDRAMALTIADHVEMAAVAAAPPPQAPATSPPPPMPSPEAGAGGAGPPAGHVSAAGQTAAEAARSGIDLLLGVELEASLRFGSSEMTLSDLLALGPGDVVQLDRALTDPVDLLIGDKIVARGEVVLVNGSFGLQVTEVAEPRKSLESIRCLF